MASIVAEPIPSEKSAAARVRKPSRPNYNFIHRKLLPVEVHPLPTLIPHNPLSLVAIVLSYLAQVLSPPQRPTYDGYFSSATSSIHITDPAAVRALWEMGFFGRGSLSRSEPTWLETQRKRGSTAEENTGQRRNERRLQKLERARIEQEEIAKQLSIEIHSNVASKSDVLQTNKSDLNGIASMLGSANIIPDVGESTAAYVNGQANGGVLKQNCTDLNDITSVPNSGQTTPNANQGQSNETIHGYDEWRKAIDANGLPTPPPTTTCSEADQPEARPIKRLQRQKTVRFSPTIEAREFDLSSPIISPIKSPGSSPAIETVEQKPAPVANKEHLHISLEEAFFLSYGLGVLNVYCDDSDAILPPSSLLSLFRRHSYYPPRSLSVSSEPDDPFMLSYAVYHHYRSLGWVVRSGVKFGVDYLLYNRGPAFSHAEFALVILPSYTNEHWKSSDEQRKSIEQKTKRTWSWLHGINRVQAQVHKQLVLCYVDVPPPLKKQEKASIDIGQLLSRYKVRDVSVRRFTPNRMRG